MTLPGPGHWTAAGLVALAIHLGVLVAVLSAPSDGAKAPGLGGVDIALTLTAARAGAEIDARQQQAKTPQDVPPREIPPADAVPPTPTEAQAVPPEPVAAVSQPIVELAPPVTAEVAVAVEPTKSLPVPPTKPAPVKSAPPDKVTAKTPPKTSSAAPAKQARPVAPADRVQQASRATSASQGRQDDSRKGQSADERNALGGGPVGTPAPDYINVLRYWLERNKTYPKDARRLRQQGVVHLYFRVTRNGRVLSFDIRKSSGHVLLDGEAEEMLKRAQPLPKFPDDMPGGYLDVVVPVLFSLRGNS
ncbi:energy transducer TonB [bacterium SCSIO 12827]|nr:energy transducer TonB [bacterium SCSIO 12827]